MAGLADKVKQAQGAFGAAEPQPVAGTPCPPPLMVKQAAPPPVAQAPAPVAVAPAPAQKEEKTKTWVEIVLVDMEGKPVPDVRYQVTLPGGEVKEGRLNSYGQAGFYELDPGNCKITFPDLDAEAWEPA